MPDKSEWRKKKVVGKEKSKKKPKRKQRELRESQQYHLDATNHLDGGSALKDLIKTHKITLNSMSGIPVMLELMNLGLKRKDGNG